MQVSFYNCSMDQNSHHNHMPFNRGCYLISIFAFLFVVNEYLRQYSVTSCNIVLVLQVKDILMHLKKTFQVLKYLQVMFVCFSVLLSDIMPASPSMFVVVVMYVVFVKRAL